jgi:hypothetical protein
MFTLGSVGTKKMADWRTSKRDKPPQVIRKQNRKVQIAQSGEELKGSSSFWRRGFARETPNLHYTISRTICQVKNAKKLHKSHS